MNQHERAFSLSSPHHSKQATSEPRRLASAVDRVMRRDMLNMFESLSTSVRIRHYGVLANRGKTDRLNLCRSLMGYQPRDVKPEQQTALQ